MAGQSSYLVAEAVADEAAILEAMLQEALETKKRRMVAMEEDFSQNEDIAGYNHFDGAVANYAKQLRAWVDLQVEAHLNEALPDLMREELANVHQESDAFRELVSGELTDAHQHSEDAIEIVQRLKAEVESVEDAHARMVSVVQGMSEELANLNVVVTAFQTQVDMRPEEKETHTLARIAQHDEDLASLQGIVAELQEIPAASMETRREVGELIPAVQVLERRLCELRGVTDSHSSKLADTEHELSKAAALYLDLETRVEALRKDVEAAASHKTLETRLRDSRQELRTQIDESEVQVSEKLTTLQQKHLAKLRAETNAALKNVAAAVTHLDEQLWRTDQRLGQRIDNMMHMQLRGAMEHGNVVRHKLVDLISPRTERSAAADASDKISQKKHRHHHRPEGDGVNKIFSEISLDDDNCDHDDNVDKFEPGRGTCKEDAQTAFSSQKFVLL